MGVDVRGRRSYLCFCSALGASGILLQERMEGAPAALGEGREHVSPTHVSLTGLRLTRLTSSPGPREQVLDLLLSLLFSSAPGSL